MLMHVISFDIPYPANYGGVIDIYYRLKAFQKADVKVILHCFQYAGKQKAPHLESLCHAVYYYPRKSPLQTLSIHLPYIVYSRRSSILLNQLKQDDHPIWFEGLHTCYYLDHPALIKRKKYVRLHNVEWQYYKQLRLREEDMLKKLYFRIESHTLKSFEEILHHADRLFAISPKDEAYYRERYPNVEYLPAFHPFESISSLAGRGSYCLYHGKLSVPENNEAALFLVNEVFAGLSIPFIIAGADPQASLIAAISDHDNIILRHNPSEEEMLKLMQEAHIHVLPTFQDTGIKLKLLNGLYAGRHVITNPTMVEETGLETACILAEDGKGFREAVDRMYARPFTEADIEQRKKVLGARFDNDANMKHLLGTLG